MSGSIDRHTRTETLSNGISLVFDEFNPRGSRTVVMAHGGGQTRGSWARAARFLAEHDLRVMTLDARGHGDSSWSDDGDYRAEALASDLDELLDRIGGRMCLVGASMGGIMSLIVAARDDGRRIDGLVLADITPRVNREGVDRIHAFMRGNPSGFASLDEAADAVARYNPLRPRPSDTSGLMRNLRERDGRLFWHWDPRFLDSWHPEQHDVSALLEASARKLRMPVLLVHAAESDVVRQEEVNAFRLLIPDARYCLIPETGHMVVGDDGKAFSSAILDFLESIESGEET